MNLNQLRKKIDDLDQKLVKLLNERAQTSIKIGELKIKNKKGIYAPDRESEVFRHVKALNKGPMSSSAFEAIYREVMSSSLSLEKPLKIAYLGPRTSFTHIASIKKFGAQLEYVACSNISEVFQVVEHEECDYGVVPIENSTEGAVTHTIDALVDSDLKICSQLLLPISQTLMSKGTLKQIKKVYSNPQVFGQCRQWLVKNLPNATLVDTASTTKAAEIATKDKTIAAIGSELAAKEYRLKILRKNLQDSTNNTTRFLVLSKTEARPTKNDRTSVVFSIKDRVGALHDMLTPFYKNKINLTKIESRPLKKKAWEYYFFVDLKGHQADTKVKKALIELEKKCQFLKILGSYPVIE